MDSMTTDTEKQQRDRWPETRHPAANRPATIIRNRCLFAMQIPLFRLTTK
jgi:hypothetical protein